MHTLRNQSRVAILVNYAIGQNFQNQSRLRIYSYVKSVDICELGAKEIRNLLVTRDNRSNEGPWGAGARSMECWEMNSL